MRTRSPSNQLISRKEPEIIDEENSISDVSSKNESVVTSVNSSEAESSVADASIKNDSVASTSDTSWVSSHSEVSILGKICLKFCIPIIQKLSWQAPPTDQLNTAMKLTTQIRQMLKISKKKLHVRLKSCKQIFN